MGCCERGLKFVYHRYEKGQPFVFLCDCESGDKRWEAYPKWRNAKKTKFELNEPDQKHYDKYQCHKWFEDVDMHKSYLKGMREKHGDEVNTWYRDWRKWKKQ
jgi:hypothetical protein